MFGCLFLLVFGHVIPFHCILVIWLSVLFSASDAILTCIQTSMWFIIHADLNVQHLILMWYLIKGALIAQLAFGYGITHFISMKRNQFRVQI